MLQQVWSPPYGGGAHGQFVLMQHLDGVFRVVFYLGNSSGGLLSVTRCHFSSAQSD